MDKKKDTYNTEENSLHSDAETQQFDNIPKSSEGYIKSSSKSTSVIKELLTYALIFLLCVFVIPKYVMQRTSVDGISMENNLQDKDQLLVEKVSYHFKDPSRFDIVVFHPYGDASDDYYVKRVIGLPGETIQIIGSDIYINDNILEENYGKTPIVDAGIAEQPITLGEDEFFVLGDNRGRSTDSRSESVGVVERKNIKGQAFVRIWPLSSIGFLD